MVIPAQQNPLHTVPEVLIPSSENSKSLEKKGQVETIALEETQPVTSQNSTTNNQATVAATTQASPVTTNQNIVNKTTKKGKQLHHIEKSPDKLTTLADTEEEQFIEEVETAHGANI